MYDGFNYLLVLMFSGCTPHVGCINLMCLRHIFWALSNTKSMCWVKCNVLSIVIPSSCIEFWYFELLLSIVNSNFFLF